MARSTTLFLCQRLQRVMRNPLLGVAFNFATHETAAETDHDVWFSSTKHRSFAVIPSVLFFNVLLQACSVLRIHFPPVIALAICLLADGHYGHHRCGAERHRVYFSHSGAQALRSHRHLHGRQTRVRTRILYTAFLVLATRPSPCWICLTALWLLLIPPHAKMVRHICVCLAEAVDGGVGGGGMLIRWLRRRHAFLIWALRWVDVTRTRLAEESGLSACCVFYATLTKLEMVYTGL